MHSFTHFPQLCYAHYAYYLKEICLNCVSWSGILPANVQKWSQRVNSLAKIKEKTLMYILICGSNPPRPQSSVLRFLKHNFKIHINSIWRPSSDRLVALLVVTFFTKNCMYKPTVHTI